MILLNIISMILMHLMARIEGIDAAAVVDVPEPRTGRVLLPTTLPRAATHAPRAAVVAAFGMPVKGNAYTVVASDFDTTLAAYRAARETHDAAFRAFMNAATASSMGTETAALDLAEYRRDLAYYRFMRTSRELDEQFFSNYPEYRR